MYLALHLNVLLANFEAARKRATTKLQRFPKVSGPVLHDYINPNRHMKSKTVFFERKTTFEDKCYKRHSSQK